MIDELLADAEARALAERLRPKTNIEETLARVSWSILAEPGDGVAGFLIAELGAAEALRAAALVPGRKENGTAIRDAAGAGVRSRAFVEGRKRWFPRADPRMVVRAMRDALDVSARLVLPVDGMWSRQLDDLGENAPILLWVRGDPEVLRNRGVAIVGARASTAYGEHLAAEFAGDLALSGELIVSGGAYGIDGVAHRAALGVGGATVAFVAGGIDRLYPAGHQRLFSQIIEEGAVLSELPCGAAPTRWRFLARNRLIAAAAAATVVVEAGWRSGTLNTAGHAASLGRPLGAVPGPVTSAASAGCHRLLREYDAVCVTQASDLRELLGPAAVGAGTAPVPADEDTGRLWEVLSDRTARDVRDLAGRSGLSEQRVRASLGLLQLEHDVEQAEGGWRRSRRWGSRGEGISSKRLR